jgi:N-acetylglucosaminyldiphosphoundecaprenol N-acetyl-beta-D-mannosaminyltransferase
VSRDIQIFGIRVTAQRFDEAIERLLEAAVSRVSFRAHFCTVHSLVEATANKSLAEVFATASMVCTDGMPLVALARRANPSVERVAGPDAMPALCDRGRAVGLRHFFLGGAEGVAAALAHRLGERFPGLVVAGTFTPPFRPMSDEELAGVRATIRESGANVVWIGLGAPKQELFAADLQAAMPGVVVLPVGAAFDFHAGRKRRAPRWMQRAGLEWLFRVVLEPRRLWLRYLSTNARFLYLLVRDRLTRSSTS